MTSPVVSTMPVAAATESTTHSSTKRFALGIFDDEDVLLHAIDNVRGAGVKIYDVFSPYPVHGIDDALGIERSRLPIAAFFYGMCGLAFALWLQIYTLGFDCFTSLHSGHLRVDSIFYLSRHGNYFLHYLEAIPAFQNTGT
jgi:hypothetical protein